MSRTGFRGVPLIHAVTGVLVLALASIVGPVPVSAEGESAGSTVTIGVRVRQDVQNVNGIHINARATGGSWATLGTIPVDMSGLNRRGTYRYGDASVEVPLTDRSATVEVRVWQSTINPRTLYISARVARGSWATLGTVPLDMSGLNERGTYRYGDISLEVPLPSCSSGIAVPRPSARAGLVSDCEALLAGMNTLAGKGRLDWDVEKPITSWDGITVDEDRVTRIDLPARGLNGSIPEELGSLLHLQALNLADNELAGEIPETLEDLPRLQAINFVGNEELTGRVYRHELNRNVYIPLDPQATAAMTRKAIADVTIEFEGEFSATVHDAFLREFTSVVQYFAERHNLVTTQPIKILVVEHYDLGYGGHTIRLNEGFLGALAHEYVHALQDELSGGARGPRWMGEGGAVHFEYLYDHAVGWWPLQESIATLENARGTRQSLEAIEWNIVSTDVEEYALGHLATRYLITLAGGEALWDFYRQRTSTSSWKSAFEEAFGLSVQEFYEAFEAHRALVLPPLPVVRGVVLGPDGEPAGGILVWSLGYFDDGAFAGWLDFTESDGSFTVAAEGEEIRLRLHHPLCGDVYGYVDSVGDIIPGGVDAKPAARLFDFDGATELTIGVIHFPVDPESPCPDAGAAEVGLELSERGTGAS